MELDDVGVAKHDESLLFSEHLLLRVVLHNFALLYHLDCVLLARRFLLRNVDISIAALPKQADEFEGVYVHFDSTLIGASLPALRHLLSFDSLFFLDISKLYFLRPPHCGLPLVKLLFFFFQIL